MDKIEPQHNYTSDVKHVKHRLVILTLGMDSFNLLIRKSKKLTLQHAIFLESTFCCWGWFNSECWSHIKWLWIIDRICKQNNLTHHSMRTVVTYKYWNRFVLWLKQFINCKQCSLEQRKITFTQMSLTLCTDVLPKTKLLQNKYLLLVHVELNPLWLETPLERKMCQSL